MLAGATILFSPVERMSRDATAQDRLLSGNHNPIAGLVRANTANHSGLLKSFQITLDFYSHTLERKVRYILLQARPRKVLYLLCRQRRAGIQGEVGIWARLHYRFYVT